jgi:hypothetical protein
MRRQKGLAHIRRKTMRVMMFMKATEDSEKGTPPTAEAFAAMGRFTEELVEGGIMVASAGLKPSTHAKRISVDGSSRTVIDGPRTSLKYAVQREMKSLPDAFSIHISNSLSRLS